MQSFRSIDKKVIASSGKTDVRIYKRKIIRKKKKTRFRPRKKVRFKKNRKKTRFWLRKREDSRKKERKKVRTQDLDHAIEKGRKGSLNILFFLNTHLRSIVAYSRSNGNKVVRGHCSFAANYIHTDNTFIPTDGQNKRRPCF